MSILCYALVATGLVVFALGCSASSGSSTTPQTTTPQAPNITTQQAPNITTQQALRALERLTTNVMAMTGAQTDRMTRDDGWRLLSMGRHIERLSTLAEALSEAFDTGTLNSDVGFSLVLGFFDSTITYRSRYLQQRAPESLVELLALDRDNPRSLAWISQTLASRIAKLSGTPSGTVPSMLASFKLPHQWKSEQVMALASAHDADAIIAISVMRKQQIPWWVYEINRRPRDEIRIRVRR